MASAITSLGIGSGVLTSDVIDKLKNVDTSRIIKPIERKITLNNQKQDAQKLLTSLIKTFKASASALSYNTIFDNKSVEISGKSEIKVDAGATVESFTLETTTLAKKDITKLGAVASKVSDIASADGRLEIKIGSDPANPKKTLSIAYTAGMTLNDLTQAITEAAGDDISASVLQTGDGEYSLVLSSKSTGENSTLTINDVNGNLDASLFAAFDATTNPTGYEKVQAATDAKFKYNGIAMTRSTNEIKDIILGVNITLKKEGDFSRVDISQDTSKITGELKQFVDSYNTLITNIHDMTLKNKETGAEGVFNSNNFVKSISRELTKAITVLSSSNNSLLNYGIDLNRQGRMSFDSADFEKKLSNDPDSIKVFFSGGTDKDGNKTTGIFETIDERIKEYTGYGKLLSTFESDLKTEGRNLSKNHLNAQKSLDARYEIMSKRFMAYDAIISRINAQFSSLKMIIDSESNSK
ncbi:flagellar filament capping protein FliD [Sulfurimonas sp.]|uniref:flagellar filament capping protein FliD n=1 Tax=Sulfurimonas sp. TaxID=2022749 RepID=UPI002B45E54C|nr:flagellar filament capping protein FliD [Sulfurimonas sp.]